MLLAQRMSTTSDATKLGKGVQSLFQEPSKEVIVKFERTITISANCAPTHRTTSLANTMQLVNREQNVKT